jgi:xanthine dehydrogenase FAD-binding subunit
LDAAIITQGPGGGRTLNLSELLCGLGQTSLQEKELIREIVLPVGGQLSAFRKIGSRTSVTIARVSLAVAVDYDRDANAIISGKAALGALGPAMICPPAVEKFMSGRKVDDEFAGTLARLLSEAIDQAIADRESRPYKAMAVKGLTFDVINDLLGDKFTQCNYQGK